MLTQKTGFVTSLLLLSATAGFTQSELPGPVKIKAGSSIRLRASSNEAVTFQWLRNDSYIPQANRADLKVKEPGSYTVISFNAQGCASDISEPVLVVTDNDIAVSADVMIEKTSERRAISINEPFEYLIKVANMGIGDASEIRVLDTLPEELTFDELVTPLMGRAHYNAGTRTVLWQIDRLNNSAHAELRVRVKALRPGIIKNTASVSAVEPDPDSANNSSSDSKPIIGIIIPNVFTPNGDGKNDRFEIPGIENYENEVTIVNRWGGTVYQSKSYRNEWQGDGLNEGTYFYVIKVRSQGAEWEVFKGYVTLLREKK
ncbi:T9SS type B sorting domain-containing protein [Pedobacter deserti]|uniref:T9SS type B sorting domain-containing protein n=1 Tax=Pedobacter deserti TaxID=2817382 RepID=UPI00210AA258|nr:gliding motility-associated C-terminal domain-containing protein [Pedobacter sp. SYSU D00382]